MKNKYSYLLIGLIALLIPLLVSCIPPTTSAPTTSTISPITQVQTDIITIKTQLDTKADKASVTTIDSRLVTIEGKVGTLQTTQSAPNSYAKTETYTRAEVDAIIASLKSNQTWITSTTGTTTTTTGSPTGSVTFATNPVSVPQTYSATTGSGQSIFYTMHVVNGSSAWQYVKPIVTLTVAPSYSSRAVTGITVSMSSGSCSMTGSIISTTAATSTVGNFSISPSVGNGAPATTSLVIIPVSGCNGSGEFQIGAGQSQDVLIQISGLTSSDVTLWNTSNSISARQM